MEFYKLPELLYSYNALEPYIDEQTMRVHHLKHHQAYVDKLNIALEKDEGFLEKPIEELLMKIDHIPEDIRQAVINNGGGHANHSFFWKIMTPDNGGEPSGKLMERIMGQFGSFNDFKKLFSDEALNRFGSGWAWFCRRNEDGSLVVHSLPNQDSPLLKNMTPLLCLDVWEHAYYLTYQNRRNEYIENWWNAVNWKQVESNFEKAEG